MTAVPPALRRSTLWAEELHEMRIIQPYLHRGDVAEMVATFLALALLAILGGALIVGLNSLP